MSRLTWLLVARAAGVLHYLLHLAAARAGRAADAAELRALRAALAAPVDGEARP